MRKFLIFTSLLVTQFLLGQTLGRTTTSDYEADFEKRASIWSIPEYDGESIPIALLEIGFTPEVVEMYPELGEKRVGLGLTNITLAYFDELWPRFEFVETKDAIKDRMITQSKATAKGFTANKVSALGNIMLAEYFLYIEVYDFSVSEDETVNLKDGVKNKLVTRLGMQVKMVDARTGLIFSGSGLGKATTTREMTFTSETNLEDVKFNQSSVGVSTRKALETAVTKIVKRMIRRKIFEY